MEREFRRWMRWYGKQHQDFELIQGDFLDDCFLETISQSSIVFVNNFAFGPAVDQEVRVFPSSSHPLTDLDDLVTFLVSYILA